MITFYTLLTSLFCITNCDLSHNSYIECLTHKWMCSTFSNPDPHWSPYSRLLQHTKECWWPNITRVLTVLQKNWEQEQVKANWKKSCIVKLPKKGDLSLFNNWQVITLLFIPSKVLCKVMLDRLKDALDKKLRPEQAGLRQGRSYTNHISTLYASSENNPLSGKPLCTQPL
jgi:hypothetical protein